VLTPIAPFLDPKSVLRERMKGERRAAAAARPDAAAHAARCFLEGAPLPEGAVVALYHPLRDELGTAQLAAALDERGVVLALPAVEKRGRALAFRRWRPGDALLPGRYGTLAPAVAAEPLIPDIVVTPLLAFTRDGARLGYGGGYYDRTLAALRARGAVLAIGYGYAAQQVDALPVSRLDEPLDWIVTEREAFPARGRGAPGVE
jgi:5-formyltetrahydrofolate cyclo-ligase